MEHRRITQEEIVAKAKEWLGTPYHHQAATKHAGCDCLGFVRGLFFDLHGFHPELPPAYSKTWGEFGKEELMLDAAERNLVAIARSRPGYFLPDAAQKWEAGDVLMFRLKLGMVAKHCAVATGPETMIHSYSGIGVVETKVGIWSSRLAGVFKFPGL